MYTEESRKKLAEWRAANRDKIAAIDKRYREKHKEKLREKARKYVADLDPDKKAARREYQRIYMKTLRTENPAKAKSYDINAVPRKRNWRFLKEYGISVEDYNQLLDAQDHRCAICRRTAAECRGKHKNLVVDHCHSTKAMRSLLCDWCNRALGLFQEDPKILRAAAEYLERHTNKRGQ